MADNFGVYDLTANVETLASSSLYDALEPPSGNINLRRLPERLERDHNEIAASTGSFGLRSTFVLPELSSSMHEVTSLNAFFSGTTRLENTAVPASGNMFYSKQQRFVKSTYKLTASAVLPVIPAIQDHGPATDENLDRSSYVNGFVPVSGSYRNTTIFDPSVFEIDVPEYGKIRDVKVWVEFVHDHRGGPGSGSFAGNPFLKGGTGATGSYYKQGLQGVQLALRSPNVDFKYAHPLWNDPQTFRYDKWPKVTLQERYKKVPDLLSNSYLLWAGHACEEDLGMTLGNQTASLPDKYFSSLDLSSSSFDCYDFPYCTGSQIGKSKITGLSVAKDASSYDLLYTDAKIQTPNVWQLVSTHRDFDNPNMKVDNFVDALAYSPHSLRIRKKNGKMFAFTRSAPGKTILYTRPDKIDSKWQYPTGSALLSATSFPTIISSGVLESVHTATISGLTGISSAHVGKLLDFSQYGTFLYQPNNAIFRIKAFESPNVVIESWSVKPQTANAPFLWYVYDDVGTRDEWHWNADGDADMAVDSNGIPHFVSTGYRSEFDSNVLNYGFSGSLNNNTGSFLYRMIDHEHTDYNDGFVSRDCGRYAKIEIDANDRIHVAYQDAKNNAVKYAYKDLSYDINDTFSLEFVTSSSEDVFVPFATYEFPFGYSGIAKFCAEQISLAVNPKTQNPYIAWADFKREDQSSVYMPGKDIVYLAKRENGVWISEKVAEFTNVIGTSKITPSVLKFGQCLHLGFDNEATPIITVKHHDVNDLLYNNPRDALMVFKSSSVGWANDTTYKAKKSILSNFSTGSIADTTFTTDSFNNVHVFSTFQFYGSGSFSSRFAYLNKKHLDNLYTLFVSKSLDIPLGKYFDFDTDIDMRTIFDDSSLISNTRHLDKYFDFANEQNVGPSTIPGQILRRHDAYPSPFSSSINFLNNIFDQYNYLPIQFNLSRNNHMSGANFPWLYDERISKGAFEDFQSLFFGQVLTSVPYGWLTGGGGAAAVNEFPTTGSNLGPNNIQPVYPLLDDVYVEKLYDEPSTSSFYTFPSRHGKVIGFRPGLRGTEVHGKWKLLLGVAGDETGGTVKGNLRAGVFFRQFRLEFLLDKGEEVTNKSFVSKDRRFKKVVPRSLGRRLVHLLSGSASWDIGINGVFTNASDDYGATVGISDDAGSDRFAVFSRLTGSIVDILSGSGRLESVQGTFLHNEFGTPFIPISSGSSTVPSIDPFTQDEIALSKQALNDTLNQTTLIAKDNTLSAHLTRAKAFRTTRDIMIDNVKLSDK
jgi:hypothetical protein